MKKTAKKVAKKVPMKPAEKVAKKVRKSKAKPKTIDQITANYELNGVEVHLMAGALFQMERGIDLSQVPGDQMEATLKHKQALAILAAKLRQPIQDQVDAQNAG